MHKVFAHKLKVKKEKYTVKFFAPKNKYVCYYFFISKLKSPDDDYDNK